MRAPSLVASSPLVRSLRLLRPFLPSNHRQIFAGLAVIGIVVGLLEAMVLAFITPLASSLAGGQTEDTFDVVLLGSMGRWTLVGTGLALLALSIVLRALEAHLVARIGTEPLSRLRDALMRGYLSSSLSRQQAERSGELMDVLMSHVNRTGFLVYFLAGAISAGAMFIVLAMAAAFVDPIAFVVVVGVVGILVVITIPLQRLAGRFGRLQNESSLRYAADAAEAAAAYREVRLFDAGETVTRRLDDRARQVARQIYVAKMASLFTPSFYRTMVLGFLLLGLGLLTASEVGSVASAGTVVLLLIRALLASQLVNSYTQSAAENVPFVEEIDQRLRQYRTDVPTAGHERLDAIVSVELRGVGFGFDDDTLPILQDIDLRLAQGEKVGLLGPSGSGKSTLLMILLGLREPRHGTALMNGRPASQFSARSFSEQVAAVPQEPLVLTASVRDNIRFFRSQVSDADIEAAARAAGIHDDIVRWPHGYDTEIGERGARALSGGQRQRVCIARALAGKPTLLIMDEPTSALDRAAEEVVNQTIDALGPDCAVVVVSHREAALRSCDRLLRLDNGRLSPSEAGAVD